MSALQLGGSRVLIGTCSWTDATLVKETDWYPKKTMTAAERLAYYASKFPIVEVDSTYYFPPTPELAQTWAERTPVRLGPGFAEWFGVSFNNKNAVQHQTSTFVLKGTDGSHIVVHEVVHFSVNANGVVTVDFDNTGVHCG